MRERIEVPDSLDLVVDGGSTGRGYDDSYADHARAELRALVKEAGSQEGAASRLAKAEGLGREMHQSTIGRALEGQPSARVLIALSRLRGKSIEAILGMPEPPQPITKEMLASAAEEGARKALAEHAQKSSVPPSQTGTRIIKPPK